MRRGWAAGLLPGRRAACWLGKAAVLISLMRPWLQMELLVFT